MHGVCIGYTTNCIGPPVTFASLQFNRCKKTRSIGRKYSDYYSPHPLYHLWAHEYLSLLSTLSIGLLERQFIDHLVK